MIIVQMKLLQYLCLLGKKRKRSRWGAKDDKAVVTGLVTLPADLTDEQRKHYLCEYSKFFFDYLFVFFGKYKFVSTSLVFLFPVILCSDFLMNCNIRNMD